MERSEEDERIKNAKRAEEEKQTQKRIRALQDAQQKERIAKQALDDLKHNRITVDRYNKIISGEIDDTPSGVLPKNLERDKVIRQNELIKKDILQKESHLAELRKEIDQLDSDARNPNKAVKKDEYLSKRNNLQGRGKELTREIQELRNNAVEVGEKSGAIHTDKFGLIQGGDKIIDPRLEKNRKQHERDIERFTSPSPIFPSGAEHKRRDPFTGKPTSKLKKSELVKDENFVGFEDDKPIFKKPESENKLDFSTKSIEEIQDIADGKKDDDENILASPLLAKQDDDE